MDEGTILWIHRLIWITIVILLIFIPNIVNDKQPELELLDVSASSTYNSSSNRTSIDMTLIFNRKVDSGYATIKYYDSSSKLLATDRGYFTAYGSKTADSLLIYINGCVDSYDIVSYEFEPTFVGGSIYIFLPFAIIFFIVSLLLSYREYYYNGQWISVYSGWVHHTLRINGEKCDERNALLHFLPIKLSTTMEDGTKFDATITLTNRITLKANDKLINKDNYEIDS